MFTPWKKSYDKPRQHTKKQRHYLLTKVLLVKDLVFPVVMYGCESWTIKKAEHRRIDAFELWCWRRLLRVPWTPRRSNQSILKESVLNIYWKVWWWSWNSNTLATWCEELTHWIKHWSWESLKVEGEGDDRGWDGWMASPTQWTWVWASSRSWWWTGIPGMLPSMGLQRVGHNWVTELNWLIGITECLDNLSHSWSGSRERSGNLRMITQFRSGSAERSWNAPKLTQLRYGSTER